MMPLEAETIRLSGDKAQDLVHSYHQYGQGQHVIVKYPKARHIQGKAIDQEGAYVHHALVSACQLKSISKTYKTSITVLLVAIYIRSLFKIVNKGPIVITVPVNLRKIFPSQSLRNFSYIINVSFDTLRPLEEVIQSVQDQFDDQLEAKNLQGQCARNVAFENHFLLRLLPRDLKNMFLRGERHFHSKNIATSILTNPGIVTLVPAMEDLVDHFECVLYASKPHVINMAVVTYKDKLVISLSRAITDTRIITTFYEDLQALTGQTITFHDNQGA